MKGTIKRISSGIPGLDSLVQGGLKKNNITLIAGGTGSGKTIFAIQFLIDGVKKGEPGIYITFEEEKRKLYDDMLSFGWDLAKYEKEGKFAFLEYTPEQVKKVLTEGGGIIDTMVEKIKAKRIAIDSITSFALLYEDELTKKEAALALFGLIDKWDCTALLTSQDTSAESGTISAALEFEVDGIILLYYVRKKGVRKRALEILKMRGTKHPGKTFGLSIDDKGISVSKELIEL